MNSSFPEPRPKDMQHGKAFVSDSHITLNGPFTLAEALLLQRWLDKAVRFLEDRQELRKLKKV